MSESLVRAVSDLCKLDVVASRDDCLERLRADPFDVVIVCDPLGDGAGIELLMVIAQRHPEVMRAFAADPRRIMMVSGKLGRFNVLGSVRYPLVPNEIRALLKSAQAVQAANADTSNMQHIVLEGDAPMQTDSARMDSRLEIAPDWRPEEGALIKPQIDPKKALEEFETPQWTVEGHQNPESQQTPRTQSGRTIASSNKLVAFRGGISIPTAAQQPARNMDAALHVARSLHGVGSNHGEQSARFGVGAPQHLAHSRAVQEAAVAETKAVSQIRPHARRVVIVLTRDKECLDTTVAALAGQAVSVMHAAEEEAAYKALRKHGAIAVLADVGMFNGSPRRFLDRLCTVCGQAPIIAVGGRASDTLHVAPLLSAGTIQRFLVKPMNRAQTRKAFQSVLQLPVDSDPTVPRESVPFASLIDRVTATDLRSSLNKQPWRVRLARMSVRYWQWAVGGAVLGVSAMLALAFALSG